MPLQAEYVLGQPVYFAKARLTKGRSSSLPGMPRTTGIQRVKALILYVGYYIDALQYRSGTLVAARDKAGREDRGRTLSEDRIGG